MQRNSLRRWTWPVAAILALTGFTCPGAAAQDRETTPEAGNAASASNPSAPEDSLPDAPTPQIPTDASQGQQQETTPGYPPVSPTPRPLPGARSLHPTIPSVPPVCRVDICTAVPDNLCCARAPQYFTRFLASGPHPLTPRQKAILAWHNTSDPYNFATIALISGISTAADPDSPYGPGMPGFGRNFGVAYCETAVGEFFGTFLVPSLVHQDPHYHRMPNASYPRRVWHAISQVAWTQSDYGTGMPNYSNFITTGVGDALGNLYVPGRNKSWGAGATRYATAIATDPIDNFITEFLPDVARRVNIRIVLLQQIVNQVTKQQ